MKIILFLINILWITFSGFSQDSSRNQKYSLYALSGTHGYIFNRDVISSNSLSGKSFSDYEINFARNYSLGAKMNFRLTKRKELSVPILYSHAYLGYLYTNTPNSVSYGKIQFNNILVGNVIQYNTFKWLKINYGINHCINIVDRFDDPQIATIVGWYHADGKSRINPYTFAINLGFEIKIYKKLSIQFDYMRGLNNFIYLTFENDPRSRTAQQLRYIGLLLNYKIISK